MLDIGTAMRRSAEINANQIAVISGDRQLTFRDAWDRGLRMAQALLALGLEPGDRVGVLEDNTLEAVDFFLATAADNFVRVPLYARNARESHKHMLATTNCRALVVSENYAQAVRGLDDELGLELIIRDAGYEQWLESYPSIEPNTAADLNDLFIIRHTGGTTGNPNGIAYTHQSWTTTARDWFYMLPPVGLGDRCLHIAPISHASGYLFLPVWLGGGCNILEPSFDPSRVLELIKNHRIGYFFAVATMVAELVRCAEGKSLECPSLKAIVFTSAPVGRSTALAAREVFGDRLFQMYGQTEAVPVTFMGPQEWFADLEGSDPLVSAGRVIPFAELQIRDQDNRPVGPDVVGEIAARREGQMTGIWGNPELTQRRLVDGWVLTGDVGKVDKNGFLYVLDRKNDMVSSGGFHIWPAELETVIAQLPGVVEVCAFGIPHEKWGETLAAVVVVEKGAGVTEAQVIEACREKLGSYKKPSTVILQTDPLPRSLVGKTLRRALRDPYWQGQERRVGGV